MTNELASRLADVKCDFHSVAPLGGVTNDETSIVSANNHLRSKLIQFKLQQAARVKHLAEAVHLNRRRLWTAYGFARAAQLGRNIAYSTTAAAPRAK
jgi:hypothetical protein